MATIESSFTAGTILIGEDDERFEVVDHVPGTAHDYAPENSILTKYLGTDEYAVEDHYSNYEWISPEDIREVEQPELSVSPAPIVTGIAPGWNVTTEPWNLALAKLAADYDRVIAFRYSKKDGAILEQRRVQAHLVYETTDGHTIIVGNDPDREGPRAFRLDRIAGEIGVEAA